MLGLKITDEHHELLEPEQLALFEDHLQNAPIEVPAKAEVLEVREHRRGEEFSQGAEVELVQRELLTALGNHGVVQIESHGKAFDPAVHEAMAQAPDATVPPNTVIDVFEQGYKLRDRLIRPARVVVAKEPEGEEKDQGGGESGD